MNKLFLILVIVAICFAGNATKAAMAVSIAQASANNAIALNIGE